MEDSDGSVKKILEIHNLNKKQGFGPGFGQKRKDPELYGLQRMSDTKSMKTFYNIHSRLLKF